nr:hypothetical protein [Vibrio mexicanus]
MWRYLSDRRLGNDGANHASEYHCQ